MVIGRLSPEDAKIARESSTPATHIESRLSVFGRARKNMLVVMASLPLWVGVRWTVQVSGGNLLMCVRGRCLVVA